MPRILNRGEVIGQYTLMVGECHNCESRIEAKRNEFAYPSPGASMQIIVCPVCYWPIPQSVFKRKARKE